MKRKQMQERLSRAVREATPDVLPQILRYREQMKGENNDMQIQANMYTQAFVPAQAAAKIGGRAWQRAAAMAAALVLMVMLPFGYLYFTVDSVIGLDVNPSMEIRTNQMERVLSVTSLNADAVQVLDGMNLRNVDLNVAVNALMGSMLRQGYVDEVKNSVLITVENQNSQRGYALQEKLTGEVNGILTANSVRGAVISQQVSEDGRLRALAQENDISLGKAAVVDLLVGQDEALRFGDVARLGINEIGLLLDSRQPNLQGKTVSGQASSSAYIGEEKAQDIAFAHAGVLAEGVTVSKTKIDYDDGVMVYDIHFDAAGTKYEYEVDALGGSIVAFEKSTKGSRNASGVAATADSYIGEEKAKGIALEDAKLTEAEVTLIRTQLDKEDGRMVYDVEFYSGNIEYDYEIDAVTGAIRKYDREVENHSIPKEKGDGNAVSAGAYIGEEKAKGIALEDAKLTEAEVTLIRVQLDKEDKRMVYDVEFYSGNIEYDYEIDAATGVIRKHDRDVENHSIPKEKGNGNAVSAGAYIGEEKAKSIALAHAKLAESEVSRMKVSLDREDGKIVYEVEFQKGKMEYQYDIDAINGEILEWEHDDD